MVDMEKIYNYVSELNNQAIIKEVDHSITGTSRQNQHGPNRPRQRKRKRGEEYPKSVSRN
ncbi:unnamed protein product [Meloidogyne enterolobii]|uniref:Uncharacterized protein n=1 Tax=Meloidogyne enterolobii TaxID=390850 RepID=A0ACB0YMW7_MELEN